MFNLKFASLALISASFLVSSVNAQSVQPNPLPKAAAIERTITIFQRRLAEELKLNNDAGEKLKELVAQQAEVVKQQDSVGVSPESFPEIMKNLQSQRIQLMIDLAGLDARRKVLVEAREEITNDTNNEVLKPLLEMIEIEKERLQRAENLHAEGTKPKAEVLSAKRGVLAAEVQLAEAKSRQSSSLTGERINANLLDTSLEHAEKQARLDTTKTLLETLTQSRSFVQETEKNERELLRLQETMTQSNKRIQNTQDEISALEAELDKIQ
jgi:ABC-type Na+ efflux pump permease subunit